MRKLITQLILALPLLALLFCVPEVNAQRMQGPLVLQDFETSVHNIVVSTTGTNANRRFTFELYLLDTDPEQQLVLAGYQAGVYINPGIFPAGATISVGIVPGSSQLSNTAQVPQAIEYDPVQSTINLAGRTPPGPGEVIDEFTYIPAGSIISTGGFGTRIIRIQVTSSLVFTPNSLANLMFNSSEVVTPNYASRVSHYDDTNMLIVWDPDLEVWTWSPNVGGVPPLNVQLTVLPGAVGESGTNAHVYENPVLNPQAVDPATANAGPDQGICAGQTATLAGVVGGCATGGIWSGGTGTFSPNNTTLNAVYTPGAGEASATLTLTSTGCTPAATDNVVITITDLPATPNAGTDMTVCVNGGLVTLTGLPAGGTWTGFGVTPEGVFDPANGTQTLTYTVSNSCGSAGDDVLVTVTQLPATPNAGTDMTVCVNGGLVTLTGLPAGGTWTGFGVTPEGVFDPANGTQTLTYTVSNSCGSASDDVIVTVTQLPTANAGPDLSACILDADIQLVGTPAGGVWSGVGVTPDGMFDPSVGTQDLTYTVTNGCGSDDDVMTVNVTSAASANAGADLTACSADADITLTGSPAGGEWSGFGVTPEGVFDPSFGTQTLTYSVTTGCGTASDDMTVTVTNAITPEVTIVASANPVEELTSVTFTATAVMGTPVQYLWTVDGTPSGTNNFEFTYVPENGDLVQVQMLVSETCVTVPYDDSNIITMEVTSIPIPLAAEWTGNANDQDWATAGNWDVLAVPGAITNVTIPGGLGDNYPETAGVCNNLTIENGGSVMVNPTVGGTVNVESLITGEQYHYISSPVASAQAGINLFNLATYMRAYDETEPTTQWENLYYTDYLVPFTGYSVFSPASVGDQTVSYSAGGLNSGDFSDAGLTYTGNSTADYDGYNLVGNPYASRIDLETGITRVNVDAAIYFWNPAINGGLGDHAVYTIGGTGTNGASANVAVGQGFFIKVMSEGTGTFGVSEASRTNAAQAFFKSSLNNVVRLHVAGDVYSDETVVLFNTQATNQFDSEFDAYKLKSSEVNHMYTKTSDGSELAINTLTSIEQNTSVPVYFEVAHSGMYNITASELETIAGNIPVWLEDLKTGTVQNLRENAVYSFNANVNDNANRFKLTFATVGVDDISLQNVNIWSVDKNIHMQLPVVVKGNVRVTNAAGQTLLNNEINAVGEYVIHAPVAAGVYMVTITSNEGTVTKKVFIK